MKVLFFLILGLGFSLVDYQQNTFNPLAKTLIVIRALVPNGVAQLDGRLMPGQRLIRINDVNLDDIEQITKNFAHQQQTSQTPSNQVKNSNNIVNQIGSSNSNISVLTLDLLKFTVDLLKSLPIGRTVRLGVQKPLPYPDAENTISAATKTKQTAKSLKENVANSKSVSHLNHKVTKKDESDHFHINSKVKIPMSTQITRRNKSSDTPNKFRQYRKINKKIITTSHYDLEASSTYSSSNEYIDGIDSKPESFEDETSPLDQFSGFENENYSDDIEPVASNLENSNDTTKARRVVKEEMKYGFIATSAPAILDIQSYVLDNTSNENSKSTQCVSTSSKTPNLNGHLFYASASQLKLNTRDLYNQIYGSNNANNESSTALQAAVSASELKSLQYNQTIEVKIKKYF